VDAVAVQPVWLTADGANVDKPPAYLAMVATNRAFCVKLAVANCDSFDWKVAASSLLMTGTGLRSS
jgi:hypothetical protein